MVLPDDVAAILQERAKADGISQSEFARRAVVAACAPGARPGTDGDGGGTPLTDGERERMETALRTVQETVTALTAERDVLAARVAELEHLSRVAAAEVAAAMAERDRLAERVDGLEDDRTRAKTKASAATNDRDQARAELEALEERTRALLVSLSPPERPAIRSAGGRTRPFRASRRLRR